MKQRIVICLVILTNNICLSGAMAQSENNYKGQLSAKERSIIKIASFTAIGDLKGLKPALNEGLTSGLTINEIKEVLVHLYAYCGFPRSIRGLQTFMEVLDERKAKGISDVAGAEASPVKTGGTKYERGKATLGALTGVQQPDKLSGYSAFAPVIDTFLKEHLFSDIFERDVLNYAQRELVTISVISSIGYADPMLQSHLSISLNTGISPEKLREFITVIKESAGSEKADAAQKILDKVLANRRN
ncbi:carboxymuconolactone decarboxylase family protein [Pollutibacter soli]|uniref:carboxymuconolactone decarboxylase family protein n=1 Tax=Pollutibacter soli TaxID=3034157 RepID=UPI0030135EE6